MDERCTVYQTADIIGKKWTIVLLLLLYRGGTMRFSEIKRAFPAITSKMLSSRLKELVQNGLIYHEVDSSSIPLTSRYTLTLKGKEFYAVIRHLKEWALKWNIDNKDCSDQMCAHCRI